MKNHKWNIAFTVPFAVIMINQASAQSVVKSVKPGKGLYEIVYSGKSNAVYVASIGEWGSSNGKIFKLDPQTLSVKDSIDVSQAPAFGLGLNERTQILYTSNSTDGSVHVIDLKTDKVIATIKSDHEKAHTREIVADEKTNTVYLADVGHGIWVIDGKANSFKRMITKAGKSVSGLALDSKNGKLYIVDINNDKIITYDLKKDEVTDSFPSGGKGAINIVRDAGPKRLFVANQGSGELTVLDEASGKLLKKITTGKGALGVSFDPDKNLVYVANRQDGTVTIINAATYAVVANLHTGTYPNTVAVGRNGMAYVSNKAKFPPRAKPGEKPQPLPEDPGGDVVALIRVP